MKKVSAAPEIAVLLAILAVAAFLRIYQNGVTPGWYNDEGTVINIANNLNQGRLEYLGIEGSLLIAARQPLFVYLLALIFRIFGSDIQILRNTVAILGVINTALIFLSLRKYGQWIAILCALAFALFPKAILYARFGFSYNLVALLALLCFWSADHYLDTGERRYIIFASLSIGLGVISEVAAVALIPVGIIIAGWKRWRDLFFALPLMLLPE
ncbi:MAG TPA: glycosyltransferase family 39 protein, partial [Anaerolinea sp.]|nr:glycosyltransferase family 39 protein [Anaerolinea sp.]